MKKLLVIPIAVFLLSILAIPSIVFAEEEQNQRQVLENNNFEINCNITNGYYIKNKGMCWIERDGYYDFGVAYETNDQKPQFQWQSYNLDTKKWEIVADFNPSNWVSWKTTQGNYWILCRLKTSDSSTHSDEICIAFRYDFDNFSTCIMWQDTTLMLGCNSNVRGSQNKFDIYNYGEKKWEWSKTTQSTWAAWKPHSGTFWIHFEVLSSDGRMIGQRTFSFFIPRNNFTYVYTNNTQSSARLSIEFPTLDGWLADDVRFFVWSDRSEREDIKGFYASRNGITSYIDIVQGWFKYAGWFTVQIFSGVKPIGEYKVCLNESDTAMLYARIRLNEIGWSLPNAYNWSTAFAYRSLPLDWSGNSYAIYGFQNCCGNCYAKAATFVYMARQLGFACHVIAGSVPSVSGGLTPHGWAEVYINGQTYVCDPDFQYETGRNGYMITYGQSGTWVYNIGGILD